MGFLSAVLSPSGVACALAVLGLTARFWRRRPGFSWGLLASSVLISLVFSSGMVAAALMSPLEYAYPTLRNASAYPQVDRIVVLTAWATEDPAMPLTGRLNSSAASRVLLALELARERPDCEIIVSGNEVTARIMSQALLKLGGPAERLSTAGGSTTADSARLLAPRVRLSRTATGCATARPRTSRLLERLVVGERRAE